MIFESRYYAHTETASELNKLPERSEISAEYQWRSEDIFKSDVDWEKTFSKIEKKIPQFSQYQGKLRDSASTLLACLKLRDYIKEELGRLFLYAGLKNDQDTRISQYQAYRDKATSLMVQINQATSFIQPEILSIPEDTLRSFLDDNSELSTYLHYFDDLLRTRQHVLPAEQEHLLAMTGEIAQGPYNIFSMFNNADIKFPTICDEQDRQIEVTKGRYNRLMESPDRRVRKEAFLAMYNTYGKWTNTLAATLSTAVKHNIFYARAKKYPTAIAAVLDEDNIPPGVYQNVVNTVNRHLAPLHRYMKLRKKMLQLNELHPWDLLVPIISEVKLEMSYREALEIIQKGLAPLGENYLTILKKSSSEGWIDIYENQGKRSGAYSWSSYGVHPYILLNYNGTLDDVFTIVHELGHALHSYFTHRAQPYFYSQYTTFVAEVASTLNEALLIDYLLKHTNEKQKKLYLLSQYVDQIRGTVYIQSLFAEFEKTIHDKAEAGEALTAETFSQFTRELYLRYFGPEFVMDEEYNINWCRIPHFYYNFYMYQYVTGFSAATTLSQKILAGDTAARDAYLRFLSRGSSDYSINLLKDAGVDMTSPEPIEATAKLMNRLLDEMEALV
jgi:oligoendopeptidase F